MMNYQVENTDEELLALLKNGHVNAFTQLYDRYWDRMLFIAIKKLKEPKDAEEVVQDVFLSLWARRRELVIHGSFSSYLAMAVKYKIINLLAKQKRAQDYGKFRRHLQPGQSTCTEDHVTYEDLRRLLGDRIEQLPAKGRLAFKLSREQGLSHKEIAQQMQITEKAVERNIARSVKTLYLSMRHLLS